MAVSTHHHGHDIGERLYLHRHTPIHQLPAHAKVVALVSFIFIVVATPSDQYWAFGVYFGILVVVAYMARIPARIIAPRMLVEVPFVIFAVLMPFFGPEPYVDVWGVSLSEPGLVSAWGILAKGTIGVFGSVLLAATTPARDLVLGLERLRVPSLLVQIASFMLRYIHVVSAEMHRMRVARESRGFEAKGPRAWPTLAHSVGALFIRSYERGERVHLAMLSRGYTGRMPLTTPPATHADWWRAASLPGVGLIVCLTAWMVQS
jgi:cobalt/nickel transport system permease protein